MEKHFSAEVTEPMGVRLCRFIFFSMGVSITIVINYSVDYPVFTGRNKVVVLAPITVGREASVADVSHPRTNPVVHHLITATVAQKKPEAELIKPMDEAAPTGGCGEIVHSVTTATTTNGFTARTTVRVVNAH